MKLTCPNLCGSIHGARCSRSEDGKGGPEGGVGAVAGTMVSKAAECINLRVLSGVCGCLHSSITHISLFLFSSFSLLTSLLSSALLRLPVGGENASTGAVEGILDGS